MPWADSDETSALEPWQATRERLERRGFEVGPLALHTEQSLRGFRQPLEDLNRRNPGGYELDSGEVTLSGWYID